MAEFGPNGAVITAPTQADYAAAPPKIKRVALACFLCGVAACLSVTLVALGLFGLGRAIIIMDDDLNVISGRGMLAGAGFAMFISLFNWFVFYITVPAAWLTIGLSIGRFPHRRITAAAPYYRWSAILGALLVGVTCSVFAALVYTDGGERGELGYWFGATLMGVFIGAVSGLICGGLFRAIVRPASQIKRHQLEVF
ncbi:MAG: hypothetical protein AAGI14_06195 [Pseudomonadota bacterium]